MRKNPYLRNLLATTMICGSVGIATPAFAQSDQTTPATGPAEGLQTDTSADGTQQEGQNVTVTGTRIRAPNLTATSPVTVVNSQDVQLTGTTRTEDLINSLPQAFAAQGANISNASSGTATLNLRGLGSVRTLVLVNGRRLVPGDPSSSAADINVIPSALIDRVDVLTGGASSVYGADAVAGVVNFIMNTDLEGVRLDTQYGFYQHDNGTTDPVIAALNNRNFGFPTGSVADGGTWDASLAIGAGFDDGRGHVTAYVGYRKIEAVLQGNRDYSSCNLSGTTTAAQRAAGLTDYSCGGSGTTALGSFITNVGTFTVGPNRTFIGSNGTTNPPFNFGPLNYFQRPDERYVAGAFANYEISPALQPYLEFMFMNDRTVAQIAPSGLFIGNTTSINCNNPLLSAQQRAIVCAPANLVDVDGVAGPDVFINPDGTPYNRGVLYPGRRNVEGGGRQDDRQHTSYRILAGMRGDLNDVWSYDVYYQFGQTNFSQIYQNDFSKVRLRRAIDILDNPATPGVDPTCRSVLDGTDPACVPYDIFGQNQVTPAALAYLQTPLISRGITQETVANASITGNLGGWGLQFPWATSGVGVAFGVEYRKESLEFVPDASFQSGDGAGQGAATLPVSGEFDVREAFAEARIPIVEEGFIHELSLEVGYRYSDYGVQNRSFSTDTYKLAGFFAPVRDIRFRGGYNRAVRAPNIQELFAPAVVALDGSTDPCAGAAVGGLVNGFTAAQCARTGVTAAQFGTINANPASQYNGLLGGNIALEPEIADTYTFGVVIQPRFIPRLAITVDYFDIRVKNAIQTLGADNILTSCIASGDPNFCGRINRDARGSIWLTDNGFVRDLNENIGGITTRGIDIGASYSMEVGSWGNIGLNFQGTYLDQLITDQGFGVSFDCVGFFGSQCGVPKPEWRHTARLSYTHPDGYGLSLRWRYFGGVDVDDASSDVDLAGPNTQPGNVRLPSVNYFDLAFSARIGDHYAFRLGVNNLLDRDPPLNGSQVCPAGPCNGNTWAQVYDALGRYIFAGVTLDF